MFFFVHLQISDHFNGTGPNNTVAQDRWLWTADMKAKV